MSRICDTFTKLRQNHEKALIPFLTMGYPSLQESSKLIVKMIESGADLVEIGVPFSDPMADGPMIQEASQIALREGLNLAKTLDIIHHIRIAGYTQVPIILMGYLNPFLKYGFERFCQDARDCGIDGVIVADLPPEEADFYLKTMHGKNLDTIFFVAPNTPEDRIKKVVESTSGFVYCLARTGVTGVSKNLSSQLPQTIHKIRKYTDLPICVGFGVSTPLHVQTLSGFADGCIVASKIMLELKHSEKEQREELVKQLVGDLKRATKIGIN